MPWLTSVNPREVEDRLQKRGIFVDKCAVPCRVSIASNLQPNTGIIPKEIHMGYVVDIWALGEGVQ